MASISNSNNTNWCLIESDPAVFTELLELLGCRPGLLEFSEVYSLDDYSLAALSSSSGNNGGNGSGCYGLIFLFEWKKHQAQSTLASQTQTQLTPLTPEQTPDNLFFAHQVTPNACATQAILSVLLNAVVHNSTNNNSDASKKEDIASNNNNNNTAPGLTLEDLGPTLADFAAFCGDFSPATKGLAIAGSDAIRTAHNSFAPPPDSLLAVLDQEDDDDDYNKKTNKEKGEAFHFVAYVPLGDTVYELDGLQSGPIAVGTILGENGTTANAEETNPSDAAAAAAVDTSDWVFVARTAIQEKMRAVGADAGAVKFNLLALGRDPRSSWRNTTTANNNTNNNSDDNDALLFFHNDKRQTWKAENQRRRHNYLPLAIQVLKELARYTNDTATATTISNNGNDDNDVNPTTTRLWDDLIAQAKAKQVQKLELRKQQQQHQHRHEMDE